MTTAPPRPCPRPHCGGTVRDRVCSRCGRRRDLRPSASSRGYDRTWAAYSRAWLAQYPWCGQRAGGQFSSEHSRCRSRGELVAAAVTDHIVALAAGGARFDPLNHQSLCVSCNAAKDAARGPRL